MKQSLALNAALVAFLLMTGATILAQSTSSTFQLPANVVWFDTGIRLTAGQSVAITAAGKVSIAEDNRPDLYQTPDGEPAETTSNPNFHLPFVAPGLVPWSLVGKIGDNGQPFQVGGKQTFTAQSAGELYLSINDNNFSDNSGNWTVTVTGGTPASPSAPPAPAPPVSSGNLLQNPGFENGLTAWSVSEGNATYIADSTAPRSGKLCAKGTEVNASSLGRLYQDITRIVIPGHQYRISGWIKTQNVQGGGTVVALDYVGATGWTPADGYVKEIGYVQGATGWTFYQSPAFVLPPMPADATAVWFLMDFNAATGTAWFDDLTLEDVSPPSSVAPPASQPGLKVLTPPSVNVPISPNLYQFLVFPPKPTIALAPPTDSTIATAPSRYSPPDYARYPIFTGVATECQPFTIVYQVSNTGMRNLSPPQLKGTGIPGTSGGVVFQSAPNPSFSAILQNPPASILAGQTATLTYTVTADWKTFVPPSNPIVLGSTAQDTSDAASKVIDTLEFLTRLSGNAAKVLSSESQFLEGVNDVLATSLFIGSKVYLAQYYSFQLQGSDYPISDSFSQYENVSVIWQPYKSDVTAAYYGAIFATLTGFGGFAQWESQWTAPSGVSKIMNNYPVLNNLCWYELAFGGCLSFTDSTQFPCNGLNLVTASFNCGTGPVPAGPCPSGNNSQSPLNPGGNIISPVAPAQRKRPTNTGMGPGSTVATAQPSVSPVISSVNFIGTKQTQTITISGSGFGTQTGFNGTSQYLRIQNVSANWDAGYNDDSITVKVSQWTDTQITIKGFAGDYGLSEEWKLNSGDKLTISVWNAKSGTGPATANVTVSPAN